MLNSLPLICMFPTMKKKKVLIVSKDEPLLGCSSPKAFNGVKWLHLRLGVGQSESACSFPRDRLLSTKFTAAKPDQSSIHLIMWGNQLSS